MSDLPTHEDYDRYYKISQDFSRNEVRAIMPMLEPVEEKLLSRVEWEATIERCVHGKIDRHHDCHWFGCKMEWCPGAAVGEEVLTLDEISSSYTHAVGEDNDGRT